MNSAMLSCSARLLRFRKRIQSVSVKRPQVIPQCFSFMRETPADKFQELGQVLRGFGFAKEPNRGRIDLGLRGKGGARNFAHQLHIAHELRSHCQIAVITRAGASQYPVCHLSLDQEHSQKKPAIKLQEFVHNRRGDVIRQVSGNYRSAPLRYVGDEDIERMDVKLWITSKSGREPLDERTVNFDRMQLIGMRQEMTGQSSVASANFNNSRRVVPAGGQSEALQNRIANKEVLAQPARQASV